MFRSLLTTAAIVLTALGLLSASAAPVDAAPSSNVSALAVSPAITEQILEPGKPTTTTVRVTNITRVPLPIKSSIKNLILNEQLPSGANRQVYDASAWFVVEPADFILQPNETKPVAIRIDTPAKATPGGHYATVYFQPLVPEEALTPSTAYLNARVGVLAFLVVKGKIVEQARVGRLQVSTFRQFGPVRIGVPVQNQGNVHVLPKGTVTITDIRGRTVARLPLQLGMVLPGTTRTFELNWDNKGAIGPFKVRADLRYRADDAALAVDPAKVWIVPWLPLFGATLGTALIIWFIMRTRRRWGAAWRALRGDSAP